jgi:hypothetical protein
MLHRRNLLLGLGAGLAAPAIVRYSNIMPVRQPLLSPYVFDLKKINVLPPELIKQLHIYAVLDRFRLQYDRRLLADTPNTRHLTLEEQRILHAALRRSAKLLRRSVPHSQG